MCNTEQLHYEAPDPANKHVRSVPPAGALLHAHVATLAASTHSEWWTTARALIADAPPHARAAVTAALTAARAAHRAEAGQ